MRPIVLTGCSGRLGPLVAARLLAEPGTAVLGIDLVPPPAWLARHPRFRFVRADVLRADLRAALAGCAAVAHLAFVVLGRRAYGRRRRDRGWMRAVNVEGTARVAEAARAAGAEALVLMSSAAVYGPPRGAGPAPLPETVPCAPLPGFAYAEDKAAAERAARAAAGLRLAVLRPHVILGPRAQPLFRALLALPLRPAEPDPPPRIQCVDATDVAEAVALALRRGTGAFNLAAGPPLSLGEMVRHLHPRAVPVPRAAWRATVRALWPLVGTAGRPVWLDALERPLVLDTGRATRALGWRPRHDVYDCLRRTRRPPPGPWFTDLQPVARP